MACILIVPKAGGVSATNRMLAVAWNDAKGTTGYVDLMTVSAPWMLSGSPLETGRHATLRHAYGKIFAVCSELDTIKTFRLTPWEAAQSYSLPRGTEPMDIAVVDEQTAYVTGRRATHLLKLDLVSGVLEESVDFGFLADGDRIPDLGAMALHEGRLFVQIRRLNEEDFRGAVPPAYLAVVDVESASLVDIDPALEGPQAIALSGTYPKRPMQIHRSLGRLFLSASGGFFDQGGIEMIDLDTLRTLGLVVHEADGLTGADLGSFYLISPEHGFLVFTTDLTISSHMTGFSLPNGVSEVNLHTEVDFLAPVLVYDDIDDLLFFPSSGFVDPGIHVFDAATGERLTASVIATEGPPTDMVLVGDDVTPPEPSTLEIELHPCLEISGSTGARYAIQATATLPSTNWVTLTNVVLRASPMTWCDPAAVSEQAAKHYRAVLIP